jgi:hypothetical protein
MPRGDSLPHTLRQTAALLTGAFLLYSGFTFANPGKVDVPTPTAPHEVSSTICGGCHVEIYKEWSESMHANSTAFKDPIHGAFYRKVIGDPGAEGVTKKDKYPVCLRCHAPNAALQKKTKLDSKPAFNEGVNCIYCHTITEFKGTVKKDGKLRLGQAAYTNSTTALQAPSGRNYTTAPVTTDANEVTMPFHPFPMEGGNVALQKSNDVCMGCHDRRNNFHGVPLCATGTEIADSKTSVTCQSCHMPMVGGHANHSMMGGHSEDMVRKAVIMSLDVTPDPSGYLAKITLKNQLPHKFPTGAPFRNAYVKLTAFDASGKQLWRNYETHPMKDDPKSMLVYTLGDGEGKPSMPPKAKEVLSDTRLDPHGTRVLEYEITAKEGVKVVRAELLYNLLLPKLVQDLEKVLTDDLKSAKTAAFAEQRL